MAIAQGTRSRAPTALLDHLQQKLQAGIANSRHPLRESSAASADLLGNPELLSSESSSGPCGGKLDSQLPRTQGTGLLPSYEWSRGPADLEGPAMTASGRCMGDTAPRTLA